MSARFGLRAFQAARPITRPQPATMRQTFGRRFQTTDAAAAPKVQQSIFARLWNSPVGVKTVHFWAPVMKWGLVLAGISDLGRPAENLSLTQNLALTATGVIWTRWCFVIKPRNLFLAAVNFFLAVVGVVQVSRVLVWQSSQKKLSAGQIVDTDAKDLKETAVSAVDSGIEKVKKAVP